MSNPTLARFRPVATLAVFYLALCALLRLTLFVRFGPTGEVSWWSLPLMLVAGSINDLVESLYLFVPFTLLVALVPDAWYRTNTARALVLAGSALVMSSLVFFAATEIYFFEEFDARFNLVAFDYLMYPHEVIGDLEAEYPVGAVIALSFGAGVLAVTLLRKHFLAGFDLRVPVWARLPWLDAHGALLVGAICLYPTDALSFSTNRVANELVQNGHSSFFRAAHTSEIDYDDYYVTRSRQANLQLLSRTLASGGGHFVALRDGRIDREFPARPDGLGRLNVVLVSSEAFGAEFSALYGSPRDLTPNFDRFARRGLWFSHVYASGTRTVRGLEALTSSFPPIPTVSILRRPGNEGISNWGTVMRRLGYHTSFLYGGNGYFDNMNYFYGHNGFEVIDRKRIERVRFENVWGVSDEDLFERALQHFDTLHARGEPFFSIVMTTSNHKPFTFRSGLEHLGIPPQGGGRAAGVRYADYALGAFLAQAEKHAWFDDTLFVVVADHGARVYGREEIPLETYEIPLLVYSPRHVAPRRVDTLMGQIDVAPTVMGMLGFAYRAPFFGQDVLSHPDAQRVALFNHNHDVALLRDDRMVVLGLNNAVHYLAYDRHTGRFSPMPPDPALRDLAVSYYQTAFELFRQRKF